MTFVLTASTTPGTPAKLLGVDASNNPIAVTPPSLSNEIPDIQFMIGGQGALLTTGVKFFWRAPFGGIYNNYSLMGDQSGSAAISVWKKAGAIPTVADKVSASAPMTITASQFVNIDFYWLDGILCRW